MAQELSKEILNSILTAQRNEITEYNIYKRLSQNEKSRNNQKILSQIADDELRHYNIWKGLSKKQVKPNKFKIWKYVILSKIFGINFGIKLMEKGEEHAQVSYDSISKSVSAAIRISKDEEEHEKKLISMIDEERLKYVGSMVLGLNDALVELTSVLAGLTLALQNTRLIAATGLITGIAASLSMAASGYLSTKSEEGDKKPLKSSIYTGIAYILTVIMLIFPFLFLKNMYVALSFTVINAVIIIFIFNYYISVAKDLPFRKRFFEMAAISLGIAIITFGIGYLTRMIFNVEV